MGKIICAGLGPGDPDLMSVRSDRLIRAARHVAYFRKSGRNGQARRIVEGLLAPDVTEYPMEYPVTTELPFDSTEYRHLLATFYDGWADRLAALAKTEDVVVLCEGDPFFYGSFMHMWRRLNGDFPIEIVPGVTGMSGCWTRANAPITWGNDILSVMPGTLGEELLTRRLAETDAAVIMKVGKNLAKVRRAVEAAGLLSRAVYVARGTMQGEQIMPLSECPDDRGPYFSMVLIPGQGRRL